MTMKRDIYDSLALTQDQAAFKKLVDEASVKITKYSRSVSVVGCKSGPGYEYSDYVVTIRVTHDRQSCCVFRNRTGVLVYAMIGGKVASVNHEFIFIEDYLQSLLATHNQNHQKKEVNG